ncbi:hypothetical protein GALMADRAFT_148405 [Galerina marginata CBS 339.88]|uniref:Uncharacterized protein n=1 Tax=Galerina marginata (strain CBS 339.88) TaxID=685588 RepID=A0A067S7E8_GALM3|nr:hypothetical protein GALMADRAFT_148405 [Galerina marginata CBS 339.88]
MWAGNGGNEGKSPAPYSASALPTSQQAHPASASTSRLAFAAMSQQEKRRGGGVTSASGPYGALALSSHPPSATAVAPVPPRPWVADHIGVGRVYGAGQRLDSTPTLTGNPPCRCRGYEEANETASTAPDDERDPTSVRKPTAPVLGNRDTTTSLRRPLPPSQRCLHRRRGSLSTSAPPTMPV